MAISPVWFGAFNLSDGVNFFVTSKQLDPPALAYVTENVARVPGTKTSGSRINERPITLVVRVIGTSRTDLESKLDALMGALQYRQQRLVVHALDSRYFIADCTNAPFSLVAGKVIQADVTCTFTCYQPYAYAQNSSSYTMASQVLTSIGGGNYQTDIQYITGGGNVFCYPQIVIQNPSSSVHPTSITLTQLTDGMTMTVVQTLYHLDTLTIATDPLQQNGLTASYNGGPPLAFSGSFHVIEPTQTQWQIIAAAASAPSLTATWVWTSRWAT